MATEITKTASTDNGTIKKVAAQNTHNKPAGDITSLLVTSGGVKMLQQSQRMAFGSGEMPALSKPDTNARDLSKSAAILVNASNASNEKDPLKLTQLAAAAAGMVNSQIMIAKNDNSAAKTSTDSKGFVNIIGDMSAISAQNMVNKALLESENESNKQSAAEGGRMFQAAVASGQRGVEAAQKNFEGSLESGAFGVGLQSMTTYKDLKAFKAESNSIKNNLSVANQSRRDLAQSNHAIGSSADTMMQKNQQLRGNVRSAMESHNPEVALHASMKEAAHSQIQLKSQRTHSTVMFANQGIHAGQQVIQGEAGVEGSQKQKQAEIERANQSLHSEMANTQQQKAKKAAEAKASTLQALDSALATNSNTISEMANK
ncbi:hypothetical protein [Pantoea agglomerans]|uniref:hypothetical protein n=1 Tax=Enterobacter agglomerans TaxID=549 RepID=UPI0013B9BF88|nr:hypothetical protein [Pantoea agglomerans]NEG98816.1 hypothetical protein [Pantoea agglomerans]NEH16189.1 hypothetical protein [Pantoea agglomerans]